MSEHQDPPPAFWANYGLEWHNARGYQVPASRKLVSQCWSHGANHREFGWSRQLDPEWSEEQVEAYMKGYNAV